MQKKLPEKREFGVPGKVSGEGLGSKGSQAHQQNNLSKYSEKR